MADTGDGRGLEAPAAVRLRVFRIGKHGGTFRVRSLSEGYGGCYTHWKGESIYCNGESCRLCMNQSRAIWKGYSAGEWFDERRHVWIPAVVELTEASEQDVRGRWVRGSVWQFAKAAETKDRKTPVVARLCCNLVDVELRPPFNILPTLFNLFRVASIDLSVPSPYPDRVYMVPSQDAYGVPDSELQRRQAGCRTPEEDESVKKKLREAREAWRNGSAKAKT